MAHTSVSDHDLLIRDPLLDNRGLYFSPVCLGSFAFLMLWFENIPQYVNLHDSTDPDEQVLSGSQSISHCLIIFSEDSKKYHLCFDTTSLILLPSESITVLMKWNLS